MIDKAVKAGEWFEPHLAFPNGIHTGMTLRDYFATQAMAAMLHPDCPLNPLNEVPTAAYRLADAMLAARQE